MRKLIVILSLFCCWSTVMAKEAADYSGSLDQIEAKNRAYQIVDQYFLAVKNGDINALDKVLSDQFTMNGIVGHSILNLTKSDLLDRIQSSQKSDNSSNSYKILDVVDQGKYFVFRITSVVQQSNYLDTLYVNKSSNQIALKSFINI